jgi:two-component system sensor histidine kinase/response regulator
LAAQNPTALPSPDDVSQRELLERLSVAIQAAGLQCWEFSYVTGKFTWVDSIDGVSSSELDMEAAHRLLMEQIVPEDAEAMRVATLRALDEGAEALSSRMRRRGPDGRLRHYQVYQRFFRDAAGRPLRALGATRDITEEVEAAERLEAQAQELETAKQRLERASFSVQEGHWELDVRTRKHWASSNYYALLGYAPGEIRLDTLDDVNAILHPEDLERAIQIARAHLAGQGEHDLELRIRCKGGEYRWFHLRGNAQRDAHGVATLLSGSIQDITKQKLAEDALRLTQERFERAIRGTQDGLWEVDMATGKLWMSPRMHELLGFEVGELGDSNTALRDRVHPDDLARSDAEVQQAIAEDRGIDLEVRLRRKSGEYRWFRLRGKPESNYRGAHYRASGSMQDVTEAREARDALVRASEVAQAANQAKSAFLANVSHEIRTPMNGIIGMTSLLLDTPLDGTQRDYADMIRTSADSLLTVINDLLDFSKIEAGKLDIESIEMDLPSNIEDIAATMAFQAAAKGLELIVHVHPDVPACVRGDPQRIRQCLINLLGNAIKFTHTGEIAAEVSLLENRDSCAVVRFEVRDTGIGIAPETMPSLFQPFVQADSSTTRHFGGTGLGLSIVRRLVEMMGGEVGADSTLGKGSRFWFTLPMQRVATAAPPAERPVKCAGRRVLVVDDNATNRRVLAAHLTHAGYDVKLASGARDALATMRVAISNGRPFDLVIVDYQMPDMDGAMLGAEINSDPRLSQARVVLLTSMDRHGDMRRFAALGFAGYLSKPVKARELLVCLEKVLAHDAQEFHAQTHPIVTTNAVHEHSATKRFGGRVLLVEDNIVNQKVAQRFLERLGCQVVVAGNGVECLTEWEQGGFDLVLMDVQMPIMDGYTATREIRDREAGRRRTPIVALTANAMTGQLERCLEAGMDGLLTKPLAVDALQDVLERHGLALNESAPLDATAVSEILTAVPEGPPLDVAQLREMAGDDAEFFRSIAETFASSSAELFAQMRAAAATGNYAALAKAAHALKGASANLHAERLREQSAELERAGGRFARSELEKRLAEMTRESERVCAALHELATGVPARAVG